MRRLLTLAVVLLSAGCQDAPRVVPATVASESPSLRSPIVFASPLGADRVSLVSVLSDAGRWNDKPIVTAGYMRLEFEGSRLCLHRDDVQYTIITNCVRLSIDDEARVKSINDRYVALEGILKSEGGLYPARIEKVVSVAPLPTQAELGAWGR